MSWFKLWSWMIGSTDRNLSTSTSNTVHEELMFHFRELVNQKIAEGQAFDTAWEQAENQFGSLRRYEGECQAMQMERRMTWRVAVALIGVLILACAGWTTLEVHSFRLKDDISRMRDDLATLRSEQVQLIANEGRNNDDRLRSIGKELSDAVLNERLRNDVRQIRKDLKGAEVDGTDLTGLVLNEGEQPLPEATVLVILKTWPGGRYLQEAFTATTNTEGKFRLPELVPSEGQYAIQVAALKEGFAFKSFYQLIQSQPSGALDPITLQLQSASVITLVIRNEKGEPIPDAQVTPFSRKSKQGETHQIYFQGSEPVHRTTDAEGRVRLSCFHTGDTAEIYLQSPGNDWDQRAFEVSTNDIVVEVASAGIDTK